MSVDYYACERCGDTYCDCGNYVSCEGCGISWCSDECAEADGYIKEKCKLGLEVCEQCLQDDKEDCIRKDQADEDKYINCCGCENYISESCKYCRNEDYKDDELLDIAMKYIECDRQFLIDLKNKEND
ncbi:hypothetical protein [Clostridium sardiniense]|uniref:hypothetical protein n=1 Tax=Clostridium sardiniense TaxID=29369 RepID=UPI00195A23A6|nr:hypothetical protein [Clostridium sardiniense]MBM7836336.1 hypothetical protein [Clostridium sardiniense]